MMIQSLRALNRLLLLRDDTEPAGVAQATRVSTLIYGLAL